jgi:hypothetical protein
MLHGIRGRLEYKCHRELLVDVSSEIGFQRAATKVFRAICGGITGEDLLTDAN